MSERRVLFIVEGKRGEPRFLQRMHQVLFGTKVENIYSYETVVYDLLERMFPKGYDDEGLDVVSVLREKETDDNLRAMLAKEFSDAYLVFDMDPHHQKYNRRLLEKAVNFFDDSTVNGKLYLNYPMLESYKHLKMHNDAEYLHRIVGMDRDALRRYKSVVDSECDKDFRQLEKYTEETFVEIIRLNLCKTNNILNSDSTLPDVDSYLAWNGNDILSEQERMMDSEGRVYVLNTSSFIPVDYSPSRFCRSDSRSHSVQSSRRMIPFHSTLSIQSRI